MGEESEERKFQFLRNGDAEPSDLDWNKVLAGTINRVILGVRGAFAKRRQEQA